MDSAITSLPSDIFLLILRYISPIDVILCRAVSIAFNQAFTDPDVNRFLLLYHYPRAREARDAKKSGFGATDWTQAFAKVASRYFHLKSGTPKRIEKIGLAKSLVTPAWARYYPVGPWLRQLQFENKKAPFHYPDTLWTFDDGLLVFPSATSKRYEIYDLAVGSSSQLNFDTENKIIRRIRLKSRMLVVEWCEQEPYHMLNENETVYRHYATAIDLFEGETAGSWNSGLRNEWKIHFLGMPLNSRDRFFSTHNETHYAMYLWQPNRSAWGEDEPIETLAIWDISDESSYRPSEDPSSKSKPTLEQGPKIVRRFLFADLDFYGIRQRSAPVLRELALDAQHVYVIEEDHRWMVGEQASHRPRLHKVKSTGIPFFTGPSWEDECGADGDMTMSFCNKIAEDRSPAIPPCWRHEQFPYLTITETIDAEAGVKFSARHCFVLETISIHIQPKIQKHSPVYDISLRDNLWSQLLGKGKLCGDERFLIGEYSNSEIVILHFDRDNV